MITLKENDVLYSRSELLKKLAEVAQFSALSSKTSAMDIPKFFTLKHIAYVLEMDVEELEGYLKKALEKY